MKKETEIKHIKRFLENNHAVAVDFSEDYIFNCPPSVKADFYLEKIYYADGTLCFRGRKWLDGSRFTILTERTIETDYLTEIRRFISDNRNYIERYATFTKDD